MQAKVKDHTLNELFFTNQNPGFTNAGGNVKWQSNTLDHYFKNNMNMMFKKLWIPVSAKAVIGMFLLLMACGGEDSPKPQKKVDVYLAGSIQKKPGYLKNDEQVILSSDNGSAEFISRSGTDIYAFGFTSTYKVWKNGTATEFEDNIPSNQYYGFTTSGNDVYVVGVKQYIGACPPGVQCTGPRPQWKGATIWKNGTPTELSKGDFGMLANARAWDIKVVDADVYVSGDINGNPVYWKNGTLNVLTVPDCTNPVYDITVAGTDVYTATNCTNGIYYWKNGTGTALDNLSKIDNVGAIDTDGTSVYLGGSIEGAPTLWKDGVSSKLTAVEAVAVVLDLKVMHGDSYLLVRKDDSYSLIKNDELVNNFSSTDYSLKAIELGN